MNEGISTPANLLGDPGRAAMVLKLMNGLSFPAGELAQVANVAPQTASVHLAKLVEGRLLTVEKQGRHRYYRLAGDDVADAIEALLVLTGKAHAPRTGAECKITPGTLAYARTCYAHLAGWLGVRIAGSLEERKFIAVHDSKTYTVTPVGRSWFEELGVTIQSSNHERPVFARRCLDWTERRPHLGGVLGCAVCKRFKELKWISPVKPTRAVRVTLEGKSRLWELLRIPLG